MRFYLIMKNLAILQLVDTGSPPLETVLIHVTYSTWVFMAPSLRGQIKKPRVW